VKRVAELEAAARTARVEAEVEREALLARAVEGERAAAAAVESAARAATEAKSAADASEGRHRAEVEQLQASWQASSTAAAEAAGAEVRELRVALAKAVAEGRAARQEALDRAAEVAARDTTLAEVEGRCARLNESMKVTQAALAQMQAEAAASTTAAHMAELETVIRNLEAELKRAHEEHKRTAAAAAAAQAALTAEIDEVRRQGQERVDRERAAAADVARRTVEAEWGARMATEVSAALVAKEEALRKAAILQAELQVISAHTTQRVSEVDVRHQGMQAALREEVGRLVESNQSLVAMLTAVQGQLAVTSAAKEAAERALADKTAALTASVSAQHQLADASARVLSGMQALASTATTGEVSNGAVGGGPHSGDGDSETLPMASTAEGDVVASSQRKGTIHGTSGRPPAHTATRTLRSRSAGAAAGDGVGRHGGALPPPPLPSPSPSPASNLLHAEVDFLRREVAALRVATLTASPAAAPAPAASAASSTRREGRREHRDGGSDRTSNLPATTAQRPLSSSSLSPSRSVGAGGGDRGDGAHDLTLHAVDADDPSMMALARQLELSSTTATVLQQLGIPARRPSTHLDNGSGTGGGSAAVGSGDGAPMPTPRSVAGSVRSSGPTASAAGGGGWGSAPAAVPPLAFTPAPLTAAASAAAAMPQRFGPLGASLSGQTFAAMSGAPMATPQGYRPSPSTSAATSAPWTPMFASTVQSGSAAAYLTGAAGGGLPPPITASSLSGAAVGWGARTPGAATAAVPLPSSSSAGGPGLRSSMWYQPGYWKAKYGSGGGGGGGGGGSEGAAGTAW